MGLISLLFGKNNKRKFRSKGWRRGHTPDWAKKTLFRALGGKGDLAWTKGKHYEYKVVKKPDFDAGHFNYFFYKRKLRR